LIQKYKILNVYLFILNQFNLMKHITLLCFVVVKTTNLKTRHFIFAFKILILNHQQYEYYNNNNNKNKNNKTTKREQEVFIFFIYYTIKLVF
jgi:hypothetical protein